MPQVITHQPIGKSVSQYQKISCSIVADDWYYWCAIVIYMSSLTYNKYDAFK